MLPLLVAAVIFPFAFAAKSLRKTRNGFLVPLALAACLLAATAIQSGPLYANAFFALFGVVMAWRWYAESRRGGVPQA
jgi:hypothetical protein